jgi:hypothetical protein
MAAQEIESERRHQMFLKKIEFLLLALKIDIYQSKS